MNSSPDPRNWKEDVIAAFDDEGPVAASKPGYRASIVQARLACLLASLYQSGAAARRKGNKGAHILIAEAATGVGKTLAGLIAIGVASANTRTEDGRPARAIVSTHTLALQKQFFGGKFPAIRLENGEYISDQSCLSGDMAVALDAIEKICGVRLTVAIRRGMNNFLDADRLHSHIERVKLDYEPGTPAGQSFAALTRQFAEFSAEGGNLGLIDEFWSEQDDETAAMFRPKFPDGAICLMRGVSKKDTASMRRYEAHVKASKEADILVVPHVYSILHAKWRFGILNGERPISFALFDEADRLPDAAQSVVDSSVSLRIAAKTLSKWLSDREGDEDGAYKTIEKLHEKIDDLDTLLQAAFDDFAKTRSDDFQKIGNGAGFLIVDAQRRIDGDRHAGFLGRDANTVEKIREIGLMTEALLRAGRRNLHAEIADIIGILVELSTSIDMFLRAIGDDDVSETKPVAAISWSPKRHYVTLTAKSLLPARIMSLLWNPKRQNIEMDEGGEPVVLPSEFEAICFISASISGNSRAAEFDSSFRSQVGIFAPKAHDDGIYVFPPEKFEPGLHFGKMKLRIIDPAVSPAPMLTKSREAHDDGVEETHTSPRWLKMAAGCILDIAKTRGRGTLALFPSKSDAKDIVARLREDAAAAGIEIVDPDITEKADETRKRYMRLFAEGKRVLWVSANAWVGIDMPGAVKNLVIGRIPSVPPSHIDRKIAARVSNRRGTDLTNFLWSIRGSKTFSKLTQGFGRGIRHEDDEVETTILDPRFPLPKWLQIERNIETNGYLKKTSSFFAGLWRALPERFRGLYEDPESGFVSVYVPPEEFIEFRDAEGRRVA